MGNRRLKMEEWWLWIQMHLSWVPFLEFQASLIVLLCFHNDVHPILWICLSEPLFLLIKKNKKQKTKTEVFKTSIENCQILK